MCQRSRDRGCGGARSEHPEQKLFRIRKHRAQNLLSWLCCPGHRRKNVVVLQSHDQTPKANQEAVRRHRPQSRLLLQVYTVSQSCAGADNEGHCKVGNLLVALLRICSAVFADCNLLCAARALCAQVVLLAKLAPVVEAWCRRPPGRRRSGFAVAVFR